MQSQLSTTAICAPRSLCVRLATPADRQRIYELRHDVYAQELGQHACNGRGELQDALDAFNEYLVVAQGEELYGFVSITPPGHEKYSLDKYLPRDEWPFPIDEGLYEMRLLTVPRRYRSGPCAALLMHASQRYLQMQNATRVMAIGRREVLHLYLKIGFERLGRTFVSGAVQYELMARAMSEIEPHVKRFEPLLRRWEPCVQWELECDFLPRAHTPDPNGTDKSSQACYHGGAFFEEIGVGFESLDRRHAVINADVLDAWFPPAPRVLSELDTHLDWIVRTSPPTHCAGLVQEISRARGFPEECLLPGAGSSDLIFRAMLRWLQPGARVLLLDPTYGEYQHLFRHVIPCQVDTLALSPDAGFAIDLDQLADHLQRSYDVVVLVNPNNPTGVHLPLCEFERVLRSTPTTTRVWVDEAYIDYVSSAESLETLASASENFFVCKSLSKAYALSGVRAGYLCGPREAIRDLRRVTPPWVVSLPAQIAGVRALRELDYYEARYEETRHLRTELADALASLGVIVWPGSANFVLCRLLSQRLTVADFLARCRDHGLFLRDVASMTFLPDIHHGMFRVAVKDARTNQRIVEIIRQVLAAF